MQFVHLPLPSVLEAKRAQSRLGELTFDPELVLLLHFCRSQQWTRVFEQLEKCERLSAGKPGIRWIRNAILSIARRHEELKARLAEEAASGAAGTWKLAGRDARPQWVSGDEMFLAEYLLGQGGSILETNEQMQAARPAEAPLRTPAGTPHGAEGLERTPCQLSAVDRAARRRRSAK